MPASVADRAELAGATEVITDVRVASELPAMKLDTRKEQRKAVRMLKKKLRGMSKGEREAFKNQVMRQLQEQQLSMYMADGEFRDQDSPSGISPVVLTIVTIFVPPLGVYLHQGEINTKFWISLVLTFVPIPYLGGLVYSLLVIFNIV